jgi:hypothetical protein
MDWAAFIHSVFSFDDEPTEHQKVLIRTTFAKDAVFYLRTVFFKPFPNLAQKVKTLSSMSTPTLCLDSIDAVQFMQLANCLHENVFVPPSLVPLAKRLQVKSDLLPKTESKLSPNPLQGDSSRIPMNLCFTDDWTDLQNSPLETTCHLPFTKQKDSETYECKLPTDCDSLHTLVLKIVLPSLDANLRWKDNVSLEIVKNISLKIGSQFVTNLSGQSNVMLAKLKKLWPKWSNQTNTTLTIPLMFGMTSEYKTQFLLGSMENTNVTVALSNLADFVTPGIKMEHKSALLSPKLLWLTVNKLHLCSKPIKSEEKGCMEHDEFDYEIEDDPTPKQEVKEQLKYCQQMPYELNGIKLDFKDVKQMIDIPWKLNLSHLIIRLHSTKRLSNPPKLPIAFIRVLLDGNVFCEYDSLDMDEWNWLKCGVDSRLQCTHFLIPFSRDCFTTTNAIKLNCTDQKLSLELHFFDDFLMDFENSWSIDVLTTVDQTLDHELNRPQTKAAPEESLPALEMDPDWKSMPKSGEPLPK